MNAPGVVIEEKGVPNVSVKKSPTVPLIVGTFVSKFTGARYRVSDGCIRIDDLKALQELFPNTIHFAFKVTDDKTIARDTTNTEIQYGAIAVQHYFENGGGPCYILGIVTSGDTGYAQQIHKNPSISLIASVINTTGAIDKIHAQIKPLLEEDNGYFYIATGGQPADGVVRPSVRKDQYAFYYPFLDIVPRITRSDSDIKVTGHSNTAVQTLADLRSVAPDLYQVADALIKTELGNLKSVSLPSAAAVAAAYCKTDRERGVWKAPANIVITGATPLKVITEAQQGTSTYNGINVIRVINQQTTIYGARTGELTDKQWRYVPVRRLVNQVQRDVRAALRAFVFEPNTGTTWARARGAIESYLYNIWQLGGLQGSKPEQGYRVTIDNTIMTQADIDAGKMIARIELAPVKPAEFIVLQFSQALN